MHIAKAVHAARMAPRGMDTPEQCMVAILHGLEVGLTPLAALQRIAVVNGRPTIWGDGAMALVRASGLAERITERFEGDRPDLRMAVCEVQRRGESEPVIRTFSVEDAKRARLWGKAGPWTDYPGRMLQMRARAFALRDAFADVLGGLYLREEIEEEPRRAQALEAELQKEPRQAPIIRAEQAVQVPLEPMDRDDPSPVVAAPLAGFSEAESDARVVQPQNTSQNSEDERRTNASNRTEENSAGETVIPPLPPMRSLDIRHSLAKQAARLRFSRGWSIRQPKALQRPPIGRTPDPRRPTQRDTVPCTNDEIFDPSALHQDRAAVLDLFDDALSCARDPGTLFEIVEEFAPRLDNLPRDVRLSAEIIVARHEKRIEAEAKSAEPAGGPKRGGDQGVASKEANP